uniref:Uncharacterized protein n=1 Tax=Rhizophora mucronata TaxID=61149 RepID=A0A2P2PP41_RHIMU
MFKIPTVERTAFTIVSMLSSGKTRKRYYFHKEANHKTQSQI